jgi:predicted MFS family arabinose efflux permease
MARTLTFGCLPGLLPGIVCTRPWKMTAVACKKQNVERAVADQVLGGPLAAACLHMDGILGLAGWRWLFLLQGIPPIVLGIYLFFTLPRNPSDAKFLTLPEREWLQQRQLQRTVWSAVQKTAHGEVYDYLKACLSSCFRISCSVLAEEEVGR